MFIYQQSQLDWSIYNYLAALDYPIGKDDFGEETLKVFCLFCAKLHPIYVKQMIGEHPFHQELVTFVKSLL
jgi:hypothetical protein